MMASSPLSGTYAILLPARSSARTAARQKILTPAPSDGVPSFEAYDAAKARPTPATKGSDDDLLETYLKHNGIDGLRERQARAIWHIFKTVVNKPLKQCTREDGRALVAHMEEQAGGEDEIKSATLRRRMVPLSRNCEFGYRRRQADFQSI